MSEQERQQLEAEVARVDRRRAELEIVINGRARRIVEFTPHAR